MNVIVIILIVIGAIFVGGFLYGMFLGFKEDEVYSKDKFPSWYDGIDENDEEWNDRFKGGGTVTNDFSGESFELTGVELAIYDLLIGVCYVGDHRGWSDNEINSKNKTESWFKKVNPKFYYGKINVPESNI
tara:strand:- start:967 stop:1359 length:393 start_codon:yes stop_codon:yes gene_type:complete